MKDVFDNEGARCQNNMYALKKECLVQVKTILKFASNLIEEKKYFITFQFIDMTFAIF